MLYDTLTLHNLRLFTKVTPLLLYTSNILVHTFPGVPYHVHIHQTQKHEIHILCYVVNPIPYTWVICLSYALKTFPKSKVLL